MTAGRPIDLLPDRSADSLAAWLQRHPGVEIVCRDRAGCYAEGATRGAPEATQVADRWHMWRNLGDAVERTVTKHRAHLRELPAVTGNADSAAQAGTPSEPLPGALADNEPRSGRLADRTRDRHTAVHQLIAQGRSFRDIARELGMARNTARRFARAADPEQLLVNNGTGQRPQAVAEFAPYLQRRWEQGCTNAEQLYQEITATGYRGKAAMVRQLVRPWRSQTTIALSPPAPPTVRQATGWFLRNPADLDADDLQRLTP